MKLSEKFQDRISLGALAGFMLVALFNPVFKKYDYGGGWPLIMLFAVILAFLAFFELVKKRERSLWELISLLLFIAAVITSFVLSMARNIGFSEVVAFSVMPVFYLLYAHQKLKWKDGFLRILVWSALIASVAANILYIFQAEPRLFGPFFNLFYHSHNWPNGMALFLLMVWPLGLIFIDRKSKKKGVNRSWTAKIALPLGLFVSTLLLTYSRGALIAFFGQIVLLAVYFIRRINVRTLIAGLMTVVVTAILFFGVNGLRSLNNEIMDVSGRATFSNPEKLTSVSERWEFFEGSFELIKQKPFFGWGPFSFRQAYNPIQKTFLANADHPHNIFLKIGVENGLIALAAFLAFLMSFLVVILKRWRGLNSKQKDYVYVLGVAVAGAFAHSMIDYNFNFAVNLLLLFVLLIFIRSEVVEAQKTKFRMAIVPLILAVIFAMVCVNEGVLLAGSKIIDEDYLSRSFYPRNYYLTEADEALREGRFEDSLEFLNDQFELNELDPQIWYLAGVVYCDSDFGGANISFCLDLWEKSVQMGGMNDFRYYRDYLGTAYGYLGTMSVETGRSIDDLLGAGGKSAFEGTVARAIDNLEVYFNYVENNVHFTAYTDNVESAAELIDIIAPYMVDEKAVEFKEKKEKMLQTAYKLRNNKKF